MDGVDRGGNAAGDNRPPSDRGLTLKRRDPAEQQLRRALFKVRTLNDQKYRMPRMMGIPYQIVKPCAHPWLTGWQPESVRTVREQNVAGS
jgi:hypothetical protein